MASSDLILFGQVEVLYDCEQDAGASSFASTTHTIDLSSIDTNLSTVPNVGSLNPFAEAEAKRHTLVTRLLIAAAAVLGLVIIGVIALVITRVVNSGS